MSGLRIYDLFIVAWFEVLSHIGNYSKFCSMGSCECQATFRGIALLPSSYSKPSTKLAGPVSVESSPDHVPASSLEEIIVAAVLCLHHQRVLLCLDEVLRDGYLASTAVSVRLNSC
jgi:hypothetical protein